MGELSYTTGGNSNLVSFKSAARVPITSLKAHFLPKQDLHGYSKPWVGGSGKNLFNKNATNTNNGYVSGYAIWSNGAISLSEDSNISEYISIEPETIYTLYPTRGSGASVCFYDVNKEYLSGTAYNGQLTVTVTSPANATYIRFTYRGKDIDIFQFEKGSSATSYEPYENICPIEGWNQCEVYQDDVYIPNEYQRVEYIESTTAGPWIDTQIIPNETTKCQIKVMPLGVTGDVIFGFYSNSDGTDYRLFNYISTVYFDMPGDTGGRRLTGVTYSFRENSIYEFELGNFYVKSILSNEILTSNPYPTQSFTGITSITLNNYNNTRFSTNRWYYVKIYSSNTLTFYGIPCRRKSDNKPGMYDTVSDTFYTNAGTEEFICGPDIGKTIPITFPILGKNKLNLLVETSENEVRVLNTKSIGIVYQTHRDRWINGQSFITDLSITENNISFTTGQANAYGLSYCLSLIPNQTYTCSATITNGKIKAEFWKQDNTYISVTTEEENSNLTFTVPLDTYYTIIYFRPNAVNTSVSFLNVQLELGDTATEYEPYNPNNTVYGGYIDVAKGELVQEYARQTAINSSNEILDRFGTLYANGNGIKFPITARNAPSGDWHVYCSHLADGYPVGNWAMDASSENLIAEGEGNEIMFVSSTFNFTTKQEWADWVLENNVEFIYPLATPITYKLSPTQLTSLLGQNNFWSNTNDITKVSYAIHDTALIRAAKHRIVAAEPHIITGGSTFTTDLRAPLKSAKIYFNPVQEGTGDPSPTNIRSITGWTGLSLYHSGDNLYVPNENNKGYINSSGVINVDDYSTYTDLIPVTVGSTYSFKCTTESVNGNTHRRIHGYNSEGVWVQQLGGGLTEPNTIKDFVATVTIPSGISYIRGSFRKQDLNVRIAKEDVYEVDWENEVGTLYGGYVDLIKGELASDTIVFDLNGSEEFLTYQSNTHRLRIKDFNTLYGYSNGKPISNVFKSSDTGNFAINYASTSTGTKNLNLTFPTSYTEQDTRDFIQQNNVRICCKMQDYTTYSINPIQFKSFRGINEFWTTSNDNISIEYYTH